MGTDVVVVVPYGGTCPHRAAALDHVLAWWSTWSTVVVGVDDSTDGWRKGRAVRAALDQVDASTRAIVIADADVFLDDHTSVDAAIEMVASGRARWAIPHRSVYRLTLDGTRRVLDGGRPRGPWARMPYVGQEAGGLVVVDLDTYRRAPFDDRFVGWGHEDQAAAMSWRTIGGHAWRGRAKLYHLWHPTPPRLSAGVGSDASRNLMLRYRAAAAVGPGAVDDLVREGVTPTG